MIEHPCANLPVHGFHVSLWYCEHHQAWWVHAYSSHQTSKHEVAQADVFHIDLGPFDDHQDAYALAQQWLLDRVAGGGAVVARQGPRPSTTA